MLEDVGKARVVHRAGEEGQIKDPVRIAVGDVHELRAGAVMLEEDSRRADQREIAKLLHGEALHRVAHGGQRGVGRLGRGRAAAVGKPRAEQQRQRQEDGKQFFHRITRSFFEDDLL